MFLIKMTFDLLKDLNKAEADKDNRHQNRKMKNIIISENNAAGKKLKNCIAAEGIFNGK